MAPPVTGAQQGPQHALKSPLEKATQDYMAEQKLAFLAGNIGGVSYRNGMESKAIYATANSLLAT